MTIFSPVMSRISRYRPKDDQHGGAMPGGIRRSHPTTMGSLTTVYRFSLDQVLGLEKG